MSGYVRTLWNNTLDLLKEELTEISFNTWIKTIEPVSIKGNTVKLEVPAEFNKGILESRYSSLVRNAISQVTKKDYSIVFNIAGHEEEDVKITSYTEDYMSCYLNPKYTFDKFVIGNSN